MKHMIPSKEDKITVKVESYKHNKSLQLTLNWDADINDWVDAFKTVLIHQTFCEDTIKELFELWHEYDEGCNLEQELAAVTKERDELKALLTKEQGAVTISRNGYVQELERERDEARVEWARWNEASDDADETIARLLLQRDEAREQRDALTEALEQLMAYQPRSTVITTNERHVWSNAKDALQSLTTNADVDARRDKTPNPTDG